MTVVETAWGLVLDALQIGFRVLPWPTRTGLRKLGAPTEASPVIITGNYDLTVRRVVTAMRGTDAWLVVADSRGINVWCAAAGGQFTTHNIVSALLSCGIDEKVKHRRAILPQLAATGAERNEIAKRTGWKTEFGPVYAKDLPQYLQNRHDLNESMRRVRFGFLARIEMALAWAVPIGLLASGAAALIRPSWVPPIALLTLCLALAVFYVYDHVPGPKRLVLMLLAVAFSLGFVWLAGGQWREFLAAASAAAILSVVLTFDYRGSTPVHKVTRFEDASLEITLDTGRCVGADRCLEVCPEGVFQREEGVREIVLASRERCIRCGACIVQCPKDALFFADSSDRRVDAGTVRRFKLNMLGKRVVTEPVEGPVELKGESERARE